MIRRFITVALGFAFLIDVLSAVAAQGPGFPSHDPTIDLRKTFVTPPPGYGEVPFWWWTGEKLDKERLLWELEELHRAGVSGTQINDAHTRSDGWKTAAVKPAIFSDAWWDIFAFMAKESAKRGMGIGLSGYTLDWPGRDNLFRQLGITTDDLNARILTLHSRDVTVGADPVFPQPHDAAAVSITAFSLKDGHPVPGGGTSLDPQVAHWKLPQGQWRIVTVMAEKRPETYDPLNPESGRRVIDRFLTPFLARTPPEAHKALNYFFQDELRLAGDSRLWSAGFADQFAARKGYDVRPKLAALFMDIGPETAKVRLDFNDVMVSLSEEYYFKPIFDWHNSRGLIYACDPASRGKNPLEFGDYFRAMRWYTAPGFDTPGSSADLIKNKVGSSIAHLYRRPRVWVEGYHSLGWQASTETIFESSNRNFLYGSTLLNLHWLYYTTLGGWWEWAPPCYHFHMPYWAHMPVFLKYFERLSYLLSQGDHVADVAILNPHEPLVADPARGKVSQQLAFTVGADLVNACQTDFDFIDAESLARAEVKDARLTVSGEAYHTLVLPSMFAIRRASLDQALTFRRAGGHVVALGDLPETTDRAGADDPQTAALVKELFALAQGGKTLFSAGAAQVIRASLQTPDFSGPAGAKTLHRRIGPNDVYFIMDLAQRGDCTFRARGKPEQWDAWTGAQTPLETFTANPDGTTTTVSLDGTGAPLLVVFTPEGDKDVSPKRPQVQRAEDKRPPLSGGATAMALDGEWGFALKPTCNNKWGDYRLPAFDGMIGAEARHVTWAVDPPMPARMTYSYGPQFRAFGPLAPGPEADAFEQTLAQVTTLTPDKAVIVNGKSYTWQPFCFSWREGAENMPGYQNWHHGLNGKVGDEFFVLGKYDRGLYDVNMPPNAAPETRFYQTTVYAAEPCRAVITTTGVKPAAVWLKGQRCTAGEIVALEAGYTPLVVRYDAFGRAALVLLRAGFDADRPAHPLAMRWFDDPAVLPFDCFGGTLPQANYTFGAPPALEGADVTLRGELLAATIGGQAAAVALKRTLPNGNRLYQVKPADEGHATRDARLPPVEVTLTVKHAPGYTGGAAFPEPIKLSCGQGRMSLGDWARVDGLRCYSGGAVYTRSFVLTREQARERVLLDLGAVGVSCGIVLNGQPVRVLTCPPWRLDLSAFVKEGENALEVTVYNTLNNHYQTIPTRYRKAVEAAPSGLLGPVKLSFESKAALN